MTRGIPQLLEVIRDLTSRKNRPWHLVAIGFILVITAWKTKLGVPGVPRPEPDTIEYHSAQWLHEKQNLVWGIATNKFNIKKLTWYLDGKPTFDARHQNIERHEVALIRLGYFEERRYDSQGVDLYKIFDAMSKRAREAHLDENWSISAVSAVYNPETNICFVARKADLPAVESIFKQVMRSLTNSP
jgi:hypothetical protein